MMDLVCAEYEINWIPTFIWRPDQLQRSFGSFVSFTKISLESKEYMTNRMASLMIHLLSRAFPILGLIKLCEALIFHTHGQLD